MHPDAFDFITYYKLFKAAWIKYDTVDPDCRECKIMSMACTLNSDGTNYALEMFAKFIRKRIRESESAGPLVCILEHDPCILKGHTKSLIFWRWALRDEVTLLAAMKQHGVDREKLMV